MNEIVHLSLRRSCAPASVADISRRWLLLDTRPDRRSSPIAHTWVGGDRRRQAGQNAKHMLRIAACAQHQCGRLPGLGRGGSDIMGVVEPRSEGPLWGEIVLPDDPAPRLPSTRQHPGAVVRGYVSIRERDRLAGAWLADTRSPNTLDGYRRDISEWFRWIDDGPSGEPLPFESVRRMHISFYRRWLESEEHPVFRRRGKPLQPATVHRKLSVISSFYDYVVAETNYLDANPCTRASRPEVSDESMTAGLDADEARALIAKAEESGNPRSVAIVRLLLQTGIRVSELCSANTGDLSYERGHRTIVVTRKGGKRQKLPVGRSAARALDAYLRGRRGPLFLQARRPQRIKRQHVWRVVRDLAVAAGISKPIHPHSLRHTAATLALEAGEPIHQVQDMLGHVSPKTTMRYNRARYGLDNSSVHALERVLGDQKTK